ncbi:MAG: hypothetical protein AAGF11_33165 [Myxococcota bacterium]
MTIDERKRKVIQVQRPRPAAYHWPPFRSFSDESGLREHLVEETIGCLGIALLVPRVGAVEFCLGRSVKPDLGHPLEDSTVASEYILGRSGLGCTTLEFLDSPIDLGRPGMLHVVLDGVHTLEELNGEGDAFVRL